MPKTTDNKRAFKVLDELDANLVVLDKAGTILLTNESWRNFSADNRILNGELPRNIEVGTNYLEICCKAEGPSSEGALHAFEGIRMVLDGHKKTFIHEYPCHSPDKQRWFRMEVTPLRHTKPREVVIIHTDITALKIAAQEILLKEQQLSAALGEIESLAANIKNTLGTKQTLRTSLPHTATETESARLATLSKREMEVLLGLVRGERNASIAVRLGLSDKSISTYRSRILEKLHLDTNADLVTFSARVGLL
jgi:DNA-binding CsgD family transcriptional regulator